MATVAELCVRGPLAEVIGRRINEELERDRWAPALAGEQTQCSREVAARTVARHRQALGVDAQFFIMRGNKGECVVAVLEPGGEGKFGREPIVDRHDDTARPGRERTRRRVVRVEIADDPATPVEVHDDG